MKQQVYSHIGKTSSAFCRDSGVEIEEVVQGYVKMRLPPLERSLTREGCISAPSLLVLNELLVAAVSQTGIEIAREGEILG